MTRPRFIVCVLCALFALGGNASSARAQGEVAAPDEKGVPPNRDYLVLLPFEVIDTASNNLILRFTDLVLPGNAGRSVRIERVFSNSTFGVGWRMGIAGVPMRVVEPPTRWLVTPSDFNVVPWDLQQERRRTPAFQTLEGGAIRTTYWAQPTDQEPSQYLVRTSDFGQYNRDTRILLQADGTRARYCAPGVPQQPPDPPLLEPGCPGEGYLKELSDPFGNTVTLAWQETGPEGTTGYVTARLASLTQDLGNGQTREVTFGASTDLWMPGSMTYLDRMWEYDFVDGHLLTVTPPVGPDWNFEYWIDADPPLSEGKMKQVTTPQGGTVWYKFDDRVYPVITPAFVYGTPVPFNVLVERKTNDLEQGVQTWTFEPLGLETSPYTQVTRPDGTELLYFYQPADPNAVLEGAWRLHRVEVRANGITVEADVREYDYLQAARTPASNALWGLSQPIWRTITRMGTTHKTEYAYGSVGAHFHNYHHPETITERGPDGAERRTTTRTYTHLAAMPSTPYMLGLPASEAVTEAGVTTSSSRTYDDIATGFRDTETVDGFTTTFTPDARGNVATVTKGNGKAIGMTYQWGVVKDVTTQAGVNTTRTINPDGTVASETIANRATTYDYDALSRRTESQPPGGTAPITTTYHDPTVRSTITRRGSASLETTTDGFGRPIETIDAALVKTRTEYDAEGRVTYQGYPFTGTADIGTDLAYDALGRVIVEENTGDHTTRTREYDDGANAITLQDEDKSRATTLTYRGFGHPDDARLVTVVDAADHTWTYEYDVRGNLAKVSTPTGHTRTWTRNSTSGLVTSETHPESGQTQYTEYDAAGMLKKKIDANGIEFEYGHDENDRVTSIGSGARVTTISYEPGSDNRQTVTNGDVSTTFEYETATGRLSQRQDIVSGYVFASIYGYNGNDQVTAVTYPSGRKIEYDREDEGEGQIRRVFETGRDYALGMAYHPSGALRLYTAGNKITTEITYDPHRYWVQSISAGSELQLTYGQYDLVGNVGSIGDSRPGMGHTVTYDALDRLENVNGPGYITSYTYDVHGNRLTDAVAYVYDATKLRLMSRDGVPFTYDNNGNLETIANGASVFTYTPDNMLASATVVGGVRTYSYDADNWRIKRTTPVDNTYYLRGLQGELLAEYTIPATGNATVRDYVYAGSRLLSAVTKTITPPASNDIYGTIVPNGSSVTQAMNTAGKRLLLQFQGVEGHRYRAAAWLTAGDFGCGAWLELRTAAGDLVANAASSNGCGSLLLEAVTLPASGTYYVVLDPLGSGTGTVVARLYDIHSVISPDGSLHTVTAANGQPLLLEFEAIAGQRYSVVADVTTGSMGCNVWLDLRTAQWAQVPRVQETYGCSFQMLASSAVSSSTVHFVALDPSGTNTGTVDVNLYTLVDYTNPITPNGPAVVAPILTPAQRALLTFTGTAGQRVSARAFVTSGALACGDPFELQRPDGTNFPELVGTCYGLAFREPVYLPTTGTYTVIVDPRYSHTATVSVTAYLVADDVVGTLTMNGSTVPVTLTTVGQRAHLTFAASSGQQVTVRLTNNTMGQTTVRLLKPSGTTQTLRTSSNSSFNLTTQTLSTAGTYTVEVDPNDTNLGGISVQVTSP